MSLVAFEIYEVLKLNYQKVVLKCLSLLVFLLASRKTVKFSGVTNYGTGHFTN